MKFYRVVGHNLETSHLDFERLWAKVKTTRGQNGKIFFADNSVQTVIESRHKN